MPKIASNRVVRVTSLAVAVCLTTESANAASLKFAGIAFVNSSVTGLGSRATLPAGAKIYPLGSTITGATGCPTNHYMTDGLIVAVIDYAGRPTAGSVAVTRNPATGGSFQDAPYYLDLNPGRTLQYLGPIFVNGAYSLKGSSGLEGAQPLVASGKFTLARNCQQPH